MARPAPAADDALGPAAAGAAILARGRAIFDERLDTRSGAPLAVAFSGGGDSLALLLAARAWAAEACRPVLALTVDHGLQPASADWTRQAGRIARGLGCGFRALSWSGPKPASGLAAAARRARHALIAEAARAAGARVILLGHTLDDLIEAERMRREGSSVGSPRSWSPSPVWPEGRGIFLLRPLLSMRRAELRGLLAPAGLPWIEDPANDAPASARARARRLVAGAGAKPQSPPPFEFLEASSDRAGVIRLDRSELLAAPPAAQRRLIAIACVCAGGGERLPRGAATQRILDAARGGGRFTATLAGARILGGEEIVIGRDVGRLVKSPAPVISAAPGEVSIWDGRYEIAAIEPGWTLRPLQGLASHLDPEARRRLKDVPPHARGALPVATDGNRSVICPILAEDPPVRARPLVDGRLAGACGRIAREEQLMSGSDGEGRPGALS